MSDRIQDAEKHGQSQEPASDCAGGECGSQGCAPEGSVAAGVENTGVIDRIEFDAAVGQVVLGMVEWRPWSGDDLQLYQLQEKFNAYLSFALDGEMAEVYPDLEGRPLKLVLECGAEPDPRTRHLLGLINRQISFQGIRLEVRIGGLPEMQEPAWKLEGGCGSGCGCGP
jgi:hypothetical protein